jgi:hypothetical protein
MGSDDVTFTVSQFEQAVGVTLGKNGAAGVVAETSGAIVIACGLTITRVAGNPEQGTTQLDNFRTYALLEV